MQGVTLIYDICEKNPNVSQMGYIFLYNKTVNMSTSYQIPNVTRSKVSDSNTRHRFCMNSALIPLRPILQRRKHF